MPPSSHLFQCVRKADTGLTGCYTRKLLAIIENGSSIQPTRLTSNFFLFCRWIYSTQQCSVHVLRAGQRRISAEDTELLLIASHTSFSPKENHSHVWICVQLLIIYLTWNLRLKRACILLFMIANVKLCSVPFLKSSRVEVTFFFLGERW